MVHGNKFGKKVSRIRIAETTRHFHVTNCVNQLSGFLSEVLGSGKWDWCD